MLDQMPVPKILCIHDVSNLSWLSTTDFAVSKNYVPNTVSAVASSK